MNPEKYLGVVQGIRVLDMQGQAEIDDTIFVGNMTTLKVP